MTHAIRRGLLLLGGMAAGTLYAGVKGFDFDISGSSVRTDAVARVVTVQDALGEHARKLSDHRAEFSSALEGDLQKVDTLVGGHMERLSADRATLSKALEDDLTRLAESRQGIDGLVAGQVEKLAEGRDILRRGLAWCARHGITSIQNMDGNLYQLELLAEIEAEEGLSCRVQVPFHYKNFMTLDMLDKASMMAERYDSEWLSSGMVKVFYDGVLDSWTAVMIEPYADRPDWVGDPLFSPERFAELAVAIDKRGLQIAVHSIGDGAVRAVLDGYEAAREANGARDSRHRVEHIEVIAASDVPRFAEMGVIASMQPPHPPGSMGLPLEPTVSRIGRARWPLSYAWRTLKEAGAHVVFASDWPVSPIDPILGIQAAVVRKPWAETDPDQSFSLREALAAYTVEGAYAGFMEHRKGMLKPGYLADLVVLSNDIEATAPEALHRVLAATTICGGKVTHRA